MERGRGKGRERVVFADVEGDTSEREVGGGAGQGRVECGRARRGRCGGWGGARRKTSREPLFFLRDKKMWGQRGSPLRHIGRALSPYPPP